MANSYFNLTLDTLAPQNVSLLINGGATYANNTAATLTIGTTDTPTTGYQMKIWGNITAAATEDAASWETFTTSKAVTLSTGDGAKVVYVKARDAVWNEAAYVSASIQLVTTVPIVTITGPDVDVVSKMSGKDEATFTFVVDKVFDEFKVKVVPSTASTHDTGTQIPTTAGSSNMSGTAGSYPGGAPITCVINGADFAVAAGADGVYVVKTFAKDQAGNWSNA